MRRTAQRLKSMLILEPRSCRWTREPIRNSNRCQLLTLGHRDSAKLAQHLSCAALAQVHKRKLSFKRTRPQTARPTCRRSSSRSPSRNQDGYDGSRRQSEASEPRSISHVRERASSFRTRERTSSSQARDSSPSSSQRSVSKCSDERRRSDLISLRSDASVHASAEDVNEGRRRPNSRVEAPEAANRRRRHRSPTSSPRSARSGR